MHADLVPDDLGASGPVAATSVDGADVLRLVGTSETLHVTLVEPELVVEVGVDVARETADGGGTPRAGIGIGIKSERSCVRCSAEVRRRGRTTR